MYNYLIIYHPRYLHIYLCQSILVSTPALYLSIYLSIPRPTRSRNLQLYSNLSVRPLSIHFSLYTRGTSPPFRLDCKPFSIRTSWSMVGQSIFIIKICQLFRFSVSGKYLQFKGQIVQMLLRLLS